MLFHSVPLMSFQEYSFFQSTCYPKLPGKFTGTNVVRQIPKRFTIVHLASTDSAVELNAESYHPRDNNVIISSTLMHECTRYDKHVTITGYVYLLTDHRPLGYVFH